MNKVIYQYIMIFGVRNMKKIVLSTAIFLLVVYLYYTFKGKEDSLEGLSEAIVSAVKNSPAAEGFGMEAEEAFLV